MFITYQIEASLQEVAQVCEEIRAEIGVTPFTLSLNGGELVNYNKEDMALVAAGKMTRSKYIERNKVKFLD